MTCSNTHTAPHPPQQPLQTILLQPKMPELLIFQQKFFPVGLASLTERWAVHQLYIDCKSLLWFCMSVLVACPSCLWRNKFVSLIFIIHSYFLITNLVAAFPVSTLALRTTTSVVSLGSEWLGHQPGNRQG